MSIKCKTCKKVCAKNALKPKREGIMVQAKKLKPKDFVIVFADFFDNDNVHRLLRE